MILRESSFENILETLYIDFQMPSLRNIDRGDFICNAPNMLQQPMFMPAFPEQANPDLGVPAPLYSTSNVPPPIKRRARPQTATAVPTQLSQQLIIPIQVVHFFFLHPPEEADCWASFVQSAVTPTG
jgi:hypothetical protein